MKSVTVTVQIGNSDDNLLQHQWAGFVKYVNEKINLVAGEVHFHACSEGSARWQNAAWVFDIRPKCVGELKKYLNHTRKCYKQDSITWAQGKTEFIDGSYVD